MPPAVEWAALCEIGAAALPLCAALSGAELIMLKWAALHAVGPALSLLLILCMQPYMRIYPQQISLQHHHGA